MMVTCGQELTEIFWCSTVTPFTKNAHLSDSLAAKSGHGTPFCYQVVSRMLLKEFWKNIPLLDTMLPLSVSFFASCLEL